MNIYQIIRRTMFEHRKQRNAVIISFIFNGALFGAWASRIPAFVEQFAITSQQLSMLLLCLAAGAITSFPVAGKITDSIGAARLCIITFIGYTIVFMTLGLGNNLYALYFLVFLFGGFHGAMDVAMNTWAAQVESASDKTLMPFFHAMFSLGAGFGAASGAIASWSHTAINLHFILFAASFLLLLIPLNNAVSSASTSKDISSDKPAFKLPRGNLFIVALVAFCCALSEGAMADWTAIFMNQELDSSHGEAAAAYSIFAIAMFLTRLSGQYLIEQLGKITVVRASAVSSMIGLFFILLTDHIYLGYLGFSLIGIGCSIVMPLAFSKAADSTLKNKGSAIASVAIFAYGGMLLGPVMIGFLATMFSLKIAFLLFILLFMLMFSGAKSLR